jgi:hypothetical protein
MMQIKKLQKDMIDFEDKRFYYKAFHSTLSHRPLNTLPLFWERTLSPCIFIDPSSLDEEFDALLFPESFSYEDVLIELLQSDHLSIFDTSRLLHLLELYAPKHDKTSWAKRLGIGIHQWNDVLTLNDFDDTWVQFLTSKHVPLKKIMIFSDRSLRHILLPILSFNPGINILEQIAVLLKEIAHIQTTSVDGIWQKLQLSEILHDENLQSSLKLLSLRSILFDTRYPNISSYRKVQSKKIKKLNIPPMVHVSTDQNFETPGFHLALNIQSLNDLTLAQKWLEENYINLISLLDDQKGPIDNEQ